ncbi:MAG: AI-2E family transporter [Coprococcus sp.]
MLFSALVADAIHSGIFGSLDFASDDSFFVSIDFEHFTRYMKKFLPEKMERVIHPIKEKTFHLLKIFLRSYCLIFLMTFTELSVFFVIRIPYAIWIALLVAVMDIMPVLGTGLVLLPWAAIAAFIKNILFAIGMVLLYIMMTAIRNIVEPKLVGSRLVCILWQRL